MVDYDRGASFEDEAEEEAEEISPDLWQEACWIIISAYFDEKGLVRQQQDSFDEFIQMSVQRIVEDELQISSATAVDWFNFVRDVCIQYFLDHPMVIGGPGPGPLYIATNGLHTANCPTTVGVVHRTVNHSLHFVDPVTGAHTQGVEGMWSACKRMMREEKTMNSQLFDTYLPEYMWRILEHIIYDFSDIEMMEAIFTCIPTLSGSILLAGPPLTFIIAVRMVGATKVLRTTP
eukprot:Em0013g635a